MVGPRGEGSPELFKLLKKVAKVGAEECYRKIGLKSAEDAKSLVLSRIYKLIGITAVRAAAKMKRERLGVARGDGEAAESRRSFATRRNQKLQDDYFQQFGNWGGGHGVGG